MSDQPKPTTGEWTAVNGDLNTGTTEIFPLGRHRAKTIADAHNAELAAEREAREAQGRAYGRLKEDFRKRTNKLLTVAEELQRDNQQLRSQLAAADKDRCRLSEGWTLAERKLAAAQAAMDLADKHEVELIDAAIAEATKELADELKSTTTQLATERHNAAAAQLRDKRK